MSVNKMNDNLTSFYTFLTLFFSCTSLYLHNRNARPNGWVHAGLLPGQDLRGRWICRFRYVICLNKNGFETNTLEIYLEVSATCLLEFQLFQVP